MFVNLISLGDIGTVTAPSSATPTVTCNKQMCTITSHASAPQNNLAANTAMTFTLSNSVIAGTGSKIFAIIASQCSSSNEMAVLSAKATGDNSGQIIVKNTNTGTACGGVFAINFLVFA